MKKKYSVLTAAMFVAALISLSPGAKTVKNRNVDDDKIDFKTCTYKGFKLYGKIKVVETFPDIKVQVVSAFPDLKVQMVDAFPEDCGKWHFVDNFPDTKVQFVSVFPDVKIQFVDAFPGKP